MHDIFGLDQRKSAVKWQTAVSKLGVVMAAAGMILMLLTAWRSFGAAEIEGQVLGALLMGAGASAFLGSSQRNKHVLTASLLLSLLGILLAFEFVVEVNREAKIDCALAELYTKSLATEQMLQEQKQAEVLTKLYVRMNEMEEMLSGAQEGALKAMQLSQSQETLKFNDRAFIQGKMRSIKQHADELLDSILTHPNMTAPQIASMTETQKEDLRRRVRAADSVIEGVIHKYDQGHDGNTVYEDYEKGLQALLEAYSPPDHEGFFLAQQDTSGLTQAVEELHHMKGALVRTTANDYHALDPAGHGRQLAAIKQTQAKSRESFNNQFLALLHQHEMTKHADFLQELPKQCLVENQTEGLMITVGLAVMVLEMAGMWCTLSCVLNMANKRLD